MYQLSRKLALGVLVILTLSLTSFIGHYYHGDGNYKVNTEESSMEWTGKKLTGEHNGTIKLKSGRITMGGHQLKSGVFEIDMTTITCTDLEGKSKKKLETHLKADDFFGTDKYPVARYEVTSGGHLEDDQNGNNYWVKGDFTLKGITHEVLINCKLKIEGSVLSLTSQFTIDRTKWGLKYKSKSVFPDLGDKFIYDDMELRLKLIADKIN